MSEATIITVADFVGVPYVALGRSVAGADCWGIVLLAARELFGLDYPEYFYAESEILEHACAHIGRETRGPHWHSVAAPFAPGVVHIFRIQGLETHCGLHLGGTEFLHSLPGRNACIETLDDLNWRQRRTGSYAWSS